MSNIGLGRLHCVTVTSEKSFGLVVLEGHSAIHACVEPPPAIATADSALQGRE